MVNRQHPAAPRCPPAQAFTLVEVVMAVAIAALLMGGLIAGYTISMRRAEWSAYSLAAQALAIQKIEQTRAAAWDLEAYPVRVDLVASNFPPDVQILDVPISGNNIAYATNYTTILDVAGPAPLKYVQVDCVWQFTGGRVFTNSIASYRAPDQ
jgi:prepilin-type N-terminal cleavage/methylation domain-containing protein